MTLEPVQILANIRQRIDTLDPYAVATRHAELQRGGHSAQSIPEGSRASEPPIPVTQPVTGRDNDGAPSRWGRIGPLDPVDRELKRRAKRYAQHIAEADRSLELAAREQTWFLAPPEIFEPDPEVVCSNGSCATVLEEGRQKGECSRCRSWRTRQGLEYPKYRETELGAQSGR